ncbi:UNVERIFIED_CONTAM: hypothetical protein FKN15_061455 [Acipenser sinensis]
MTISMEAPENYKTLIWKEHESKFKELLNSKIVNSYDVDSYPQRHWYMFYNTEFYVVNGGFPKENVSCVGLARRLAESTLKQTFVLIKKKLLLTTDEKCFSPSGSLHSTNNPPKKLSNKSACLTSPLADTAAPSTSAYPAVPAAIPLCCSKRIRPQDDSPVQLFYKDWPINKLLKALFKKGLPIEAGSDRAALFISYCNSISNKPVFPPQKAQQRSKLVSLCSASAVQAPLASDSATTTPQFSISSGPSSDLHFQIFNDVKQLIHPLSTSIATVSDVLDALDNRITRLKPAAISSLSGTPAAVLAAPSASAIPTPALTLPIFTQATACGLGTSASVGHRHFLSPQLRHNIIGGKDVNLVSILIATSAFVDHSVVDCGDLSVTLISLDCKKNSQTYLAVRYRGTMFYEYHKAFAAKAGSILASDNIINWAASESLGGAILFESISAPSKDRKLTNDQEELLCVMEKKFGELPRREDVITVLKSARPTFQGANIEELLLKEVKELSDGDIKVAISTVHMNLERTSTDLASARTRFKNKQNNNKTAALRRHVNNNK